MKKLICLGIMMSTVGLPALAHAQQRVTPVSWRDDGSLVIEVRDVDNGEGLAWAQGKASSDFYAACTPAALGTAGWDTGCEVCLQDPSSGGPAACGLAKLTKWPKALKSAKKSPSKKVSVTDKRTCVTGADGKTCENTIAVGKLGSVTYANSNAKRKPAIKAYFRKDSKTVLLVVTEKSPSDPAISTDRFLLLDLAPPALSWLERWVTTIDKACACPGDDCVQALMPTLSALSHDEDTELAKMSPDDAQTEQAATQKLGACLQLDEDVAAAAAE